MELNQSYDFSTLAPTLLGANFSNVKVIGIMTAEEAIKYRDIHTLHQEVIGIVPALPGVEDLKYVLLDVDGRKILLAYEYIDSYSITKVNTVNLGITVYQAKDSDIVILRNALLELGYGNIDIKTL